MFAQQAALWSNRPLPCADNLSMLLLSQHLFALCLCACIWRHCKLYTSGRLIPSSHYLNMAMADPKASRCLKGCKSSYISRASSGVWSFSSDPLNLRFKHIFLLNLVLWAPNLRASLQRSHRVSAISAGNQKSTSKA
jgi:hypothetical protein